MDILSEFCYYCNKSIFRKTNKDALEYLLNRGLSKDTIDRYLVGYYDGSYLDKLSEKKKHEYLASKLVKVYNNPDNFGFDTQYYEKFRGYITFPIIDGSDIVSLTSRCFKPNKYSPIHNHINGNQIVPYNINTLNSNEILYIVESPIDTLIMEQSGFSAISMYGTSGFKQQYSSKIKEFKGKIIWLFDSDINKAGITGALRNAQNLLDWNNQDSYIGILPLPSYSKKMDINILYLQDKNNFKNVINNAVKDSILFTETNYHKEELKKREEKKEKIEIGKKLRDKISTIKSINISDIIGKYITINKTSFGFISLCPFHQDKNTKSLIGYNNTNIFICMSGACNIKGDAITFVSKYFKLTFKDAVNKIIEDFGF